MEMLLIFLIPAVVAGLFAKYFLHETYTWQEFACSVAITGVIVSVVYFGGLYRNMMDTEILNGEITAKERIHDTYIETYSCNCRSVKSGDTYITQCDTCQRRHYTVTWLAESTVGRIQFDHKDSTSRSVYNSPDPQAYIDCYVGEPASQLSTYLNYVKAVPTSLFNSATVSQAYEPPQYPRIHSFYKVNRVINHGSSVDTNQLNALDNMLDEHLRQLGPNKQANTIAIFTDIKDPNYRYAVENAWIGGKKNDIVLFFGTDGNNIVWTDVMTWALNSGNELLVAELKRQLLAIGTVNAEAIANTTERLVDALYVRPKMEDYEYLKNDIKPNPNLLIVCWVLNILSIMILTWWFHAKVQIGGTTVPRRNYRYRY
jgi:hypothetical protein